MEFLEFEDYFYDVWDLVPFEVVNDTMFERNRELIQEMTFGLWEIYKNTFTQNDFDEVRSEMSVERGAKIMTSVFESVNKIGLRI